LQAADFLFGAGTLQTNTKEAYLKHFLIPSLVPSHRAQIHNEEEVAFAKISQIVKSANLLRERYG
jgi:hypothetical protein